MYAFTKVDLSRKHSVAPRTAPECTSTHVDSSMALTQYSHNKTLLKGVWK